MADSGAPATNLFYVKQGVDQNFLRSTLTKDVTTLESIYDLVDNAIDAARNRILERGKPDLDEHGLPCSYAGYKVGLRFRDDSISIIDNCSGIDREALTGRTFITGAHSNHKFGIGRFGIGLKRSLFRLGTEYAVRTDTGDFAARMTFSERELGRTDGTGLPAHEVLSRNNPKTLIHISGLREGVRYEVQSPTWFNTVRESLSRRYGRYVAKGLKIFVNHDPIPPFGPKIRLDGPVEPQAKTIDTELGVRVYIKAGMHELYRVTSEIDHPLLRKTIDSLTDQYGWYFVCNDRIIKIASHERELGWSGRWHPEYYGFIGWVDFVSEDADLLPWDTKKTVIDPSSLVFRRIADQLQTFAEKYKVDNKKARPKGRGKTGGTGPKGGKGGKGGDDHNENWKYLLPEMNITLEKIKLKALAHEAMLLEIERCYAGSLLLRTIIEFSLLERVKKAQKYRAVCEMIFEEQAAAGRPFTDEQKKGYRPKLADTLNWASNNPDFFPDATRRECVKALGKFKKHIKELNGVVHEDDLTNSSKLKIIRDDSMAFLEFLLSHE